jgi:hypothetical protein
MAATQTTALPDCQESCRQTGDITLACGDGNFYVESLKWTGCR